MMTHRVLLFLCFFHCMMFATAQVANKTIKVATIGNSVTYGAGIQNREQQAYPAQLQKILGQNYQVENFGRNGATLLKKGHNPYYKTKEFDKAMDFKADVLIIHLGLNDTDPRNWPNYRDEFEGDYSWLIDTLRSKNPEMDVYICKLTPIFSGHPRFLSSTFNWYWQIQSLIPKIAKANHAKVIDFNAPLANRPDLFPDYLHPTAEGAQILAKTVFNALKGYSLGLKVHETFGSHMVLQRNQPIPIRGKANAGTLVSALLQNANHSYNASTRANMQGDWQLSFPAMKAGGPYELIIKNDDTTVNFQDILIGEVWLASGQSNMAFPLKHAAESEIDIQASGQYPQIRMLKFNPLVETTNAAWNEPTLEKINALDYFQGKWKTSTPESSAEFSAIAYYFAETIHKQENVPIGIIEMAVGGSPLISWIDRQSIEQHPLLANTFTNWRESDYIQAWCRERANTNLSLSTNPKQRHPYEPAYNFEAGIAKLIHTPTRGLIWYQGESDANNTELFEQEFPVFVESWRNHWNNDFPIYQVQLSSINRPSWPHFRNAQQKLTNKIPFLYTAVSSDLGNKNDVHPIRKKEIGQRLANLALRYSYHKEHLIVNGPLPLALKKSEHQIEISFENDSGLKTSDGQDLRGFKVKTAKGHYLTPKHSTIVNNKVILTLPNLEELTEVLYAWDGYTEANLINDAGLPASTFTLKIQ